MSTLVRRVRSLRGSGIRSRVLSRARGPWFDSRLVARLTRRRHVVVLGDSHAAVFRRWHPDGWRFDVLSVGGATASGIRNPNSQTEALPRFRGRLARAKPWQPVLVALGEVDCGYVIWRRMRANGLDEAGALAQTLDRYEAFLATELDGREVMVLSAPLPTLPDDSSGWGAVAQQRSDVQVSQRARTDMTVAFNAELARRSAARGWRFVDATSAQLDGDTRLVRGDLVRHGTGDHHLPDAPFRALIAAALP